jgi:fructose-bisphosphate aldolase class I
VHQWRDPLRRDDPPAEEDGTPFLKVITDAGIIPGIKVDTGAKDLAGHPGEKITEGLDGLRDRLARNTFKWARVLPSGAR